MEIKKILEMCVQYRASDVHILVGTPPSLRLNGQLVVVPDSQVVTPAIASELISPLMSQSQRELVQVDRELDFSYSLNIEDPIEFIYTPQKSLISQRELHSDTHGWSVALKSVLREDPNVVLIGEMRDYETIESALLIAETGHLVLATLHTSSAAQTIDRIVDVFPEEQQQQVRAQLSMSLEAVVSQRLIPAASGGRMVVVETMLANSAVRSLIREGKTHMLTNVMQTSSEVGMKTMDMALVEAYKAGKITLPVAREYASNVEEVNRVVGKVT
ncbi:MAG: twitching motility protein [Microgenomates group bacterium GW2011_GWA1_46_7]|nr:MAG: twitching motility protein [Microgenomates group bacterium GW2011_GWA1_46_7]